MPFDAWVPTETETAINLIGRMETIFRGGEGWLKRERKRGKRFCLLGALEKAAKEADLSTNSAIYYLLRAVNPRRKTVAADIPGIWMAQIIAFNDKRARNYGDITRVLKLARNYAMQDALEIEF